jgi:hypothetical protein
VGIRTGSNHLVCRLRTGRTLKSPRLRRLHELAHGAERMLEAAE